MHSRAETKGKKLFFKRETQNEIVGLLFGRFFALSRLGFWIKKQNSHNQTFVMSKTETIFLCMHVTVEEREEASEFVLFWYLRR